MERKERGQISDFKKISFQFRGRFKGKIKKKKKSQENKENDCLHSNLRLLTGNAFHLVKCSS